MQNIRQCNNINNENNINIKDNYQNDKLITKILSVHDGNKSVLSRLSVRNICIILYIVLFSSHRRLMIIQVEYIQVRIQFVYILLY